MKNQFFHHRGAKQVYGGVAGVLLIFSFFLTAGAAARGLTAADDWFLFGMGLLIGLLALRLVLFGLYARLEVGDEQLVIPTLLGRRSYSFGEIHKLGRFAAPIVQRGVTGSLIQRRVGGSSATNLYLSLADGKRQRYVISSFEQPQKILKVLGQKSGRSIQKLDLKQLSTWG